MSGGFRGAEDDDLGDLFTASRPSATLSFTPGVEDISSNPFADLESSYVQQPAYSAPSFDGHSSSTIVQPEPRTPSEDQRDVAFGSSATPATGFSRETAPEPETPAFGRSTSFGFAAEPYELPTPPTVTSSFTPIAPEDQTPFGMSLSPPTSPSSQWPTEPVLAAQSIMDPSPIPVHPAYESVSDGVPDLSDLLGEEKPIVPRFQKKKDPNERMLPVTRDEKVLPVSSIGRKTPKGALAALLGLEGVVDTTEDEEAPASEPSSSKAETPSSSKATPLPPAAKEAPKPAAVSALASAANTPLPPSPGSNSPPALSRAPSFAPSQASASEIESEPSAAAYATVVSPLYTGESDASGWPGSGSSRGVLDALGGKLEALSVATGSATKADDVTPTSALSPSTPPPASNPQATTSESPFDARNANAFADVVATPSSRAGNMATEALSSHGTHSNNVSENDSSSTKGNYSRSFGAEQDEGENDGTETGRSSPVTTREESSQTLNTKATPPPPKSPPLPAVPNSRTSSPRLERPAPPIAPPPPSFTITVGDPQKIGSSLNVAAQHTVYTVRTQTTSSAFRKPDFSVLRRFSHFLWLYDALTLNNPGVIVPGMPEKNAMSRFDMNFVENRRVALQAALMKIVQHPMLVGDPDLRLFLESDSFAIDIKQRKIDQPAESKGLFASIGSTLSGPRFFEFDEYFETRRQTIDTFEAQIRALLVSLAGAAKLRKELYQSLSELQSSFAGLASCDLSSTLRGALDHASRVQERLRRIGEQQAESEDGIGGLTATAEAYARLCGSVRLVFGARIKSYHAWQAAESHLKKTRAIHEKARRGGRSHSDMMGLSIGEIADAERRAIDAKEDFEDVSKLTKAEMARFDKEKIEEFKRAVVDHIEGMIKRQKEVVVLWTEYHEHLLRAAGANSNPPPPSLQTGSAPTGQPAIEAEAPTSTTASTPHSDSPLSYPAPEPAF